MRALPAVLLLLPIAALSACALEPTPHDDDMAPRAELAAEDLAQMEVRDGFVVLPVLTSPEPFTRAGIMLNLEEDQADADVLIQARDADDPLGGWLDAEVMWREEQALVLNIDFAGGAQSAELRIAEADVAAVYGIAYELFVPSDEGATGGAVDAVSSEQQQALAAWLANNGVKARSVWNARSSAGCDGNSTKTRMAIHHTVTNRTMNGTYRQRIKQIQSFHMDSRGYCDIAYHFLVTADGSRWEGRPVGFLGAHVGGENTNNVGVALVGCFHPSGCGGMGGTQPPSEIINGTARLVRLVARHYGIAIDSSHIKGHRAWAGGTACPGDNVASKMSTIRTRARNNSYPGPG